MQIFFLKNLVSVAIISMMFSAITVANIKDESEKVMPNVQPQEEILPEKNMGSETEPTEVDLSNLDAIRSEMETPPETMNTETPLDNAPQPAEEALNENAGQSETPGETLVETPPETGMTEEPLPPAPVEPMPSEPDASSIPPAPMEPAMEPIMPNMEPGLPNEDEMMIPQEEVPDESQMGLQPLPQNVAPVRFGANAVIIRPTFVSATTAPELEPDSTDPTAEGDRKGGRHKGIRLHQKRPNLKMIPIIRMGEQTQHEGLTVIKAWNS
jgi:hypothetical protein